MVYNQKYVTKTKHPTQRHPMADDILQEKLFVLICSIQQADENAFSDFYDLTINRVYSLIYKILANTHDSEEVVSDVYAQIWQQADRYYPQRGSVLGWSLLIARCRALDLYRKRRNKDEIILDAKVSLDELSISASEPDKIVQLFEEHSRAKNALNQLTMVQQQLLSLAFFKGLSHSEISQATDIPLGSVKSHIRRALDALHSKLRD